AFVRLVNRDGRAVAPTTASLMSAAANANWGATPGFGVILTDMPGAESWPIASASFIVMPRQPDDPAAAREALKFFTWAFAQGDRLAEALLYVPMPDNVVGAIQRLWAAEIRDAGANRWSRGLTERSGARPTFCELCHIRAHWPTLRGMKFAHADKGAPHVH